MNKEKFELIKSAIEKKYVVSDEGLTKLVNYVDGRICSMIAENDYSSDNYTASGGDRYIDPKQFITLNFQLPMSDIEKVLGDDVEMFRFVSSYDIGALIGTDLEEMYDDQFMFEVELLVVDDLAEFHIEISIDDEDDDDEADDDDAGYGYSEAPLLEQIEDYFGKMSERQLEILQEQISQRLSKHKVNI